MTKILRIDASTRATDSVSRKLGDAVQAQLLAKTPHASLQHRVLADAPIEHIQNITIQGFYTPAEQMTPALQVATKLSDMVIAEVVAADILIITTPMYNFSIPSSLKAWIDQLVRIGKTFSYDGSNFQGLLTGKTVYVNVAYGAPGYLNDGPFAGADFVKPYLTFLFGFLGMTDVKFISAEATTADTNTVVQNIEKANAAIKQILA